MDYIFNNIPNMTELTGYSCVVDEEPLPTLQFVFDEIKKSYVNDRNIRTNLFIEDYGDEQGKKMMDERWPMPVNVNELASQAKIIANKYEICGTTLINKRPGFIVKIPNVRVRVRTYCNLGDYYCWIQKWNIDKFVLKIYQAMPNEEGYMVFGGASYPHPHISGSSPCLGGFEAPIRNAAGHFNMVGILSNINKYLNSYYGRSVFLRHTEFRPIKREILPIDMLKEYNGTSLRFDDWFMFQKHYSKDIKYGTEEYYDIYDNWKEKYHSKRDTIEIKPHESTYYTVKYRNSDADVRATNRKQILKTLLVQDKFKIDTFWQAYAIFIEAGVSNNKVPITFGKNYVEHEEAFHYMNDTIMKMKDTVYYYGFSSAKEIRPDDSPDEFGLFQKVNEIYNLIVPRSGGLVYTYEQMTCKDFWDLLSKFESYEDFLNQPSDHDERKDKAIQLIDKVLPEVYEWHDAYKRKVIINLDKQRRRIANGLKHTIPTPDAHQLSFETLPKD
tara:strand:- start:760 stop:2256 length:1497 start_codon:yes stop_codon:yes gene_type:complete